MSRAEMSNVENPARAMAEDMVTDAMIQAARWSVHRDLGDADSAPSREIVRRMLVAAIECHLVEQREEIERTIVERIGKAMNSYDRPESITIERPTNIIALRGGET